MPYLVGVALALGVAAYAAAMRLDRDRAFYPVVLIVVASYYVLFACMGGSVHVMLLELVFAAGFAVAASWGFKHDLRVVAGALGAHGVFDMVHGRLITNPGVPAFWPHFCGAYDVAAACVLAWLLARAKPAA